jgi:transcriptional regulator with XRE-family HTH domain
MKDRSTGTPGGAKLRQLREAAGRTQLWVETDADLGTGYLQRVESGRVVQPERATLERVLEALGTRYSERAEVLELFGYAVATPLPTNEELSWAREVSRAELNEAPFPAYVLDCAHRLVAWNRFVPRLFGIVPDDPLLGRLAGESAVAAWFDPASPMGRSVVEPDVFMPALIRALLYEKQQFHSEPWYPPLLERLQRLPRFQHYWEVVEHEPAQAIAARALVPARLESAGAGILQFRLSSEPFVRDARFRTIFFFPADLTTMQQCAAWAETS